MLKDKVLVISESITDSERARMFKELYTGIKISVKANKKVDR